MLKSFGDCKHAHVSDYDMRENDDVGKIVLVTTRAS